MQFKVRPTILPLNTKWSPGNVLTISFKEEPSQEALFKIVKFLSSQDTSGIKPVILS
jgi:hypothetical protein